jgi:UDP-N-acetylmuramoyl-tripeptide--D-alanyl-D-alanine ligase
MSTPAKRSLSSACKAMAGKPVGKPATLGSTRFVGAVTDSRAVKPGQLFFALPGERVDGFDFCKDAAKAGAAAVVVIAGRGRPEGCDSIPVIAVDDPLKALGDLAAAVRKPFEGRVVGVTGSNGKTTTKELIAAALASAGKVLATQGNLNTDVGMPLTILSSTGKEDFWVLEMAMRGPGEIDYLTKIAKPHVAVITNIAGAHLGRLGSLEAVARAKGEIFGGLSDTGIAVLPVDEPMLEPVVATIPAARQRRFGTSGSSAFVRIMDFVPAGAAGSIVRMAVGHEPHVVKLPLAGEHNARNAAAALAVAQALRVPIRKAVAGLEKVNLPAHRSQISTHGGRIVMDDCYNANPTSMLAALRTVVGSAGSGRAFAIVGDMLELGDDADLQHQSVGREAIKLGLAGVAGVGTLGAELVAGAKAAGLSPDRAQTFAEPADAAQAVAAWSTPGDWILVKASRGMRLERALEALQRIL